MAAHILPHAFTVAASLPPFPPTFFHENKPYSERRRRRFNGHDGTSFMGRRRSIGGKNKNVTVGKVGSQRVAALSKDEVERSFEIFLDEQLPKYPEIMEILGEIVISVMGTAVRQAEERGHKLLHQIRTFMIRGLLHLLRFDDELFDEAREEMENEEKIISGGLGWKGKGSALRAYNTEPNGTPHSDSRDEQITFIHRNRSEGGLRFHKPKFSHIFCDMDGTILNSKSQISTATAAALKEVSSRGVKVVIATGKTRAAIMNIFKMANLAGKDGIISEFSPGVFVQGLHVHGKQGREIYRRSLDASICREAFLYSLNHKTPIVAFSDNRCLALFGHPLLDSLETLYHEPKPEIIPSVEQLLAGFEIQKLILLDSVDGVATTLRPYWEEATKGRASVVQAVPDILEIVPLGTSKGNGVRILLDHLGVSPSEIMAIGDGENDVEMLDLASLGVALSNGSEKAKAVANVIGLSNDEDGVADAIYRYAL